MSEAGEQPAKPNDQLTEGQKVDLAAALSTKTDLAVFDVWVVGMTPLIVHAWSHKAKARARCLCLPKSRC